MGHLSIATRLWWRHIPARHSQPLSGHSAVSWDTKHKPQSTGERLILQTWPRKPAGILSQEPEQEVRTLLFPGAWHREDGFWLSAVGWGCFLGFPPSPSP